MSKHKVTTLLLAHLQWLHVADNMEFWEQYEKVALAFEQGWHYVYTNREVDKLAGLVSNEYEDSIYMLLKEFFYVERQV